MQPATQDFSKASLPRLSGLLIFSRGSMAKQFEAEPSIGRVSEAIALDLAPKMKCSSSVDRSNIPDTTARSSKALASDCDC